MSYVDQTLASDEKIVLRANFNWTYSFWEVICFIVGLLPAAGFAAGQIIFDRTFDDLMIGYAISGVAFLLGGLILLIHMVHLWTTEIVVTTARFIYKTGLISRDTKEVNLNNIEEVNLHQSIWGRIFGYGKLIMRGTGVGVIELPNIDNPIEVRRTVEDARAQRRQSNAQASMPASEAPVLSTAPEPQAAPLTAPSAPVAQAAANAPQATPGEAQKKPGLFEVLKVSAQKDKERKEAKKRK